MTILEDLVWRGDNDMKKTVLFIALLVVFACEDKEGGGNPSEITITYPTNGAILTNSIEVVTVSLSDIDATSKVEFYLNGNLFSGGIDIEYPFTYSWDTKAYNDSTYTIKAVAYNKSGASNESNSVTVYVNHYLYDFGGITETSMFGDVISWDIGDWCREDTMADNSAKIQRRVPVIPISYDFGIAYPNPTSYTVTIPFALPEQSMVNLFIIDSTGSKVTTLLDTYKSPGYHNVNWFLTNSSGEIISPGLYRVIFIASNFECYGDILVTEHSGLGPPSEPNAIVGQIIDESGEGISGASVVIDYQLDVGEDSDCNPTVGIPIALPSESDVTIWYSDSCGVDTLGIIADGVYQAGYHTINWDMLSQGKLINENYYKIFLTANGWNGEIDIYHFNVDHSCQTIESIIAMATTNDDGFFVIEQSCLPFDVQADVTNEWYPDGTGEIFTVLRDVKICAYTDNNSACSDSTTYVDIESGAYTILTISDYRRIFLSPPN